MAVESAIIRCDRCGDKEVITHEAQHPKWAPFVIQVQSDPARQSAGHLCPKCSQADPLWPEAQKIKPATEADLAVVTNGRR